MNFHLYFKSEVEFWVHSNMQMQLFDGLIHVNIVIECIFSSIYSYILAITLRYFLLFIE